MRFFVVFFRGSNRSNTNQLIPGLQQERHVSFCDRTLILKQDVTAHIGAFVWDCVRVLASFSGGDPLCWRVHYG
jgi:hypothetical protein